MPRSFEEYTERAEFSCAVRLVSPSESDRFIAKASLAPLRAMLPEGVDPEENPDLLYIAANGAVAGLVNRNGDAISASAAIAIHRSAAAKYISMDHDRKKVVGTVLYPQLARFGSNEVLTEDQAAVLNEPFNMGFAGVLWKVIEPQLARYINRIGGALDDDALSMSWEILFAKDGFSIGVGSKNVWDARVVKAGDTQFDLLKKCLKAYGGKGVDEKGQNVFRIINDDALILGYSIVAEPAAEVHGILPIEPKVEDDPKSEASSENTAENTSAQTSSDVIAQSESAQVVSDAVNAIESAAASATVAPESESFITPATTRVTPDNLPMKITSLADLKTNWTDFSKLGADVAVASIQSLTDAMQKANDKHVADLEVQTNLTQTLTQAKAAAEQRANELEQSLAQVKQEVATLKQAQASAAATQKFTERMTSLEDTFELDDEDRELLAPAVRACVDDAAFAAFKKGQEKLMCGKKKAKASAAATTTTAAATIATVPPVVTSATVITALASVTPVAGETKIPVGVTAAPAEENEVESAFGSTFSVNGKSVKDRKAAKAKAAADAEVE